MATNKKSQYTEVCGCGGDAWCSHRGRTKGQLRRKYGRERCPKCYSNNLTVDRSSTWPSLVCWDCGAFVRDYGD